MADKKDTLHEVLPKAGLVVSEKGNLTETLCKPKLLPLKSITLQKLEEMETKIVELSRQQANSSTSGRELVDTMAQWAAAARKEDQAAAARGGSNTFEL